MKDKLSLHMSNYPDGIYTVIVKLIYGDPAMIKLTSQEERNLFAWCDAQYKYAVPRTKYEALRILQKDIGTGDEHPMRRKTDGA